MHNTLRALALLLAIFMLAYSTARPDYPPLIVGLISDVLK